MNQNHTEISFVKIFLLFYRRKKTLILIPTILTCIGLALAFYLPKKYESTSIWLPSGESQGGGLNGIAAIAGLSIGGQSNEEDYFPDILVSDQVIFPLLTKKFRHSQFDSITIPEYLSLKSSESLLDSITQTLILKDKIFKFLQKDIAIEKTNSISLSVLTKDPLLSQSLNQFLVNEIIRISDKIRSEKSRVQRKFLEKELSNYKDSLRRSENTFQSFALRNRSTNSPKLLLQKQRFMRKVNIYSNIVIEMQKQYEIAYLEEHKSKDLILFLKRPSLPLKPVYPKKKLIVIATFFFGFVIAICWIIFQNWWLNYGRAEFRAIVKSTNDLINSENEDAN